MVAYLRLCLINCVWLGTATDCPSPTVRTVRTVPPDCPETSREEEGNYEEDLEEGMGEGI